MSRLSLPATLALAGALADVFGLHGLAFYALLAAVPATAVAALASYGELVAAAVDDAVGRAQVLVWGALVAALALTSGLRAPALADAAVPTPAVAALTLCLVLFLVQGALALVAELQSGREAAASRARSIRGSAANSDPTETRRHARTERERILSGAGDPPLGASWNSSGERIASARTIAR